MWKLCPRNKGFAWWPFLVGISIGVILLGAFHIVLEKTSTTDFCVSCHGMKTVYQEYQESIHFNNPSGVRASCSDCHVPQEFFAKVWRKIKASREVYHALVGTIDTPEKFEEHRLDMAQRVWAEMLENDSRECRNCHTYHAMDFPSQSLRAREKMESAMLEERTCIECHKGIAHTKPYSEDEFDD
ncbi:butanol dehydrogenase [Vibrio sp. JPW-9-11-11]|uniref:NapC/NirT family cytochrome c n=1 Tax=Vibrio sp. JPW-9-11-11 TaxID=1416532 RepID=UPI00159425BE|nr:NapC/NirT family cytochrome c [Vibrio sp. JPW-9-11-11]NVD08952.1 butanol dehydrogenase [Vibrio sp. JPW-9-11-11]